MSNARHHSEWLSLVEVSGPFLSLPVLMRIFPQGLDAHDPELFSQLKLAYSEYLERLNDPSARTAWNKYVFTNVLEFPQELIMEVPAGAPGLEVNIPEHGEKLRPQFAIITPNGMADQGKPRLLIQTYSQEQDLEKPVIGKHWKTSPNTRMVELLRGTGVRTGLITNGEQWMLVYAPQGETTTFALWNVPIWLEENITFRAFRSLLCVRRFFGVAEAETHESLFEESVKDQQAVTDQLGYQVRKAVEVLVQSFDCLDQNKGRVLLKDIPEKVLYEGALTIMMRLVFLFSAEERGLLLLGDALYDQHYAVSTLREQLRETADQQGEEILERRRDAWCRLLATFRAVYGGIEHDRLRLPAYGGSLFDPDRYPFLEGRQVGTNWKNEAVTPLEVNNRTALHLLEALQLLQVKVPGGGPAEARRLSFRALDIEQIGHVYEGLLDHTAVRAKEAILGLKGNKDKEPEIALSKLEELHSRSLDDLTEFLNEETGKSVSAIKRALSEEAELDDSKLMIACGNDKSLAERIKVFSNLLREDTLGVPAVIRNGSVYVTAGTERRSTGTHYTPRTLTEPIVQHTLEPLVYVGPAEGKPKEEWKLRSAKELLELKVCDMAMGSGAFLVQVIRYLSERFVEAWEEAKQKTSTASHFFIDKDGAIVTEETGVSLPQDDEEKLFLARRLVADRCIYGVDINPMAVEMAKLSLWLITLQKNRPFNFLDHALKCGDSLLGVSSIEQIESFSLRQGPKQITFAMMNIKQVVEEASKKRILLEQMPSHDSVQIGEKKRIYFEAETATAKVKAVADCLIAFELRGFDGKAYEDQRAEEAEKVQLLMKRDADASLSSQPPTSSQLSAHAHKQLSGHRPFHWAAEFPEVFARGGFDAFVGNPPFMGGHKINAALGSAYRDFIVQNLGQRAKGKADLAAFFFLRLSQILNSTGYFGLVVTKTITQGATREVGLDQMIASGTTFYRSTTQFKWPGTASLEVIRVYGTTSSWLGECFYDALSVAALSSSLTPQQMLTGAPFSLASNDGLSFTGNKPYGDGFFLQNEEALRILKINPTCSEVLFPYLTGQDLNTQPDHKPTRHIINFGKRSLNEAKKYKECFEILESRAKPYRDSLSIVSLRDQWWLHQTTREKMYQTISMLKRVFLFAQTSKTKYPVAYTVGDVQFDQGVVVLAVDEWWWFAVLCSNLHYWWVLEHGSSLKSDAFYVPSLSFCTFPFPASGKRLAEIGEAYEKTRRQILCSRNQGLTQTYNRFHDRGEQLADIARLRALHVEMDQAVAAAYGWSDLDLGHGFHATKQGERYTLSEPARRTVLDRLLALNHQRHEEEVKQGPHEKTKKKSKGKEAMMEGQLDLL